MCRRPSKIHVMMVNGSSVCSQCGSFVKHVRHTALVQSFTVWFRAHNETKFFTEEVNSKRNQHKTILCRNETKFRNIFVSNTPFDKCLQSTNQQELMKRVNFQVKFFKLQRNSQYQHIKYFRTTVIEAFVNKGLVNQVDCKLFKNHFFTEVASFHLVSAYFMLTS